MNLRRMLRLIPWMMRVSSGGSLWLAVAILALFTVPFFAIRYLPSESVRFTFTTIPVFMGLLTWRFARQQRWTFFASLPAHQNELILASLLTDAGAMLLLTSSFPKHDLQWYATQLLCLWTAVLFCGWWRRLDARIVLAILTCPGLALVQVLTANQKGLAWLLASTAIAILATAIELKIKPDMSLDGASGASRSDALLSVGFDLRLPIRAWRQTHLGMFLMSDRPLALFLLQYLIAWFLDAFSRPSPQPVPFVILSTALVAFSAAQLLNGKAAEFFSVRPAARCKRFYLVAGLALFCIVPPGVTRLATTATPALAYKRLEFVSFQRGGCDVSATKCSQRFSAAIRNYLGTQDFAFVADVISSPTGPGLHPGPRSVQAFREAVKRSASVITLELLATFILVLLGAVFYNNTVQQSGRRKLVVDTVAFVALAAGLAIEIRASGSLPFRGLALGLAMLVVVLARRLATHELAIP